MIIAAINWDQFWGFIWLGWFLFLLIATIYLIIRRNDIKKTEDFEDRDN